jgi:hypothetical protein
MWPASWRTPGRAYILPRMKKIACISTVLCLLSSAALAQTESAAKTDGAWFELSYGQRVLGIEDEFAFTLPQGGFFAGYKLGPMAAGLGIELLRLSASARFGDFEADQSMTQILFLPGVRYAFAGSADGRVELFGQLDLGLGKSFQADSNDTDFVEPTRLVYQLGPGLRYWVHPQFALGATAILRGERQSFSEDTFSVSLMTTSIITNFQLTGVF